MNELIIQIGISSFVAFLGGLVGYRLGIRSDRRKEYNELAEPFFVKANQEIHSFRMIHFDQSEIDILRRRMGYWQRRRFDAAIVEFREAANGTKRDEAGQPFYTDVEGVNRALKKIAGVLKRK